MVVFGAVTVPCLPSGNCRMVVKAGKMRAFKGTWAALAVLLVVWFGMNMLEGGENSEVQQSVEISLYSFEKEDVVHVEIQRPSDSLSLSETSDGWRIDGSGHEASRSMVGRIKHQLHDLTARATVIEGSGDLDRYGLGSLGVRVTIRFRDGTELSFVAGDPNPTGVSHYIMPLPGETVYTVKKSAVDFFSLEASQFREARFASFDTALVDQVEVKIADREDLVFQRGGSTETPDWNLVTPVEMPVSTDTVRTLIGRVTQLRADSFEAEIAPDATEELGALGLNSPRAIISFAAADTEPVVLLIGSPVSDSGAETLAYMMLQGDPSVYVSRHALLDDFSASVESFRSMMFVGIEKSDVAQISVTLGGEDSLSGDQLAGSATIMFTRESWVWGDGAPVSGSTPDRVATRTSLAEADAFVTADEPMQTIGYGFDAPMAVVDITDNDGVTTRLLVGGGAEPAEGLEGRDSPRWYAGVDGREGVYLVSDHLVSVLRDLIREHKRKLSRDEEHLSAPSNLDDGN